MNKYNKNSTFLFNMELWLMQKISSSINIKNIFYKTHKALRFLDYCSFFQIILAIKKVNNYSVI